MEEGGALHGEDGANYISGVRRMEDWRWSGGNSLTELEDWVKAVTYALLKTGFMSNDKECYLIYSIVPHPITCENDKFTHRDHCNCHACHVTLTN